MPVPAEILAVERPKNTRVKKSGDHYYVIKRTCIRKNGKNIPKELGTIGEIINGKYIEKRTEPREYLCDIKDYGEIALFDKASGDLLQELAKYFHLADAERLYVIALLRACYGDIRNRDISVQYETSFASEMYPGIHLSENTISTFLENMGKAYGNIRSYMTNRVKSFAGGHLIIDGTLRENNSYTNMFSEMSRKGSKKGSKDLSLLYAYDPEKKEPLAAKPYAGNMLDVTSTKDFINEFGISSGMLIMDKGCFSKKLINQLKDYPHLAYLMPLKQNSKLIQDYKMTEGIANLMSYKDSNILYKKVALDNYTFLYSFRDPKGASDQEIGYLVRNQRKNTYSSEAYLEKQKEFGTIVFQSNRDLPAEKIYEAYLGRWEIEVMFDFYKNIIDLETLRVEGDYRIYATEFINFLSVIISCRVKKYLSSSFISLTKNVHKPVSEIYSYRQILLYLSKYKMVRSPDRTTWKKNALVGYIQSLIETLGI